MNYDKQVNQANPSDKPMVDSDYYAWLLDNDTGNNLDNHIGYLSTLGFIRGTDKISEDVITKLRYIHSQYFYVAVKPTLPAIDYSKESAQ